MLSYFYLMCLLWILGPNCGFILTKQQEQDEWAMPLFNSHARLAYPDHIAYMPYSQISAVKNGTYWCGPAKLEKGKVSPKKSFQEYFDGAGLKAIANADWGK
jgi:hypothetical protein